jgi:hypothetical protein
MELTLQQAADVIGKTPDEILFVVQDGRLNCKILSDPEITYNEDGTISFTGVTGGNPEYRFDFNEVIAFKKELDEGLDGTLRQILEG